jgi:hypothetical protein
MNDVRSINYSLRPSSWQLANGSRSRWPQFHKSSISQNGPGGNSNLLRPNDGHTPTDKGTISLVLHLVLHLPGSAASC